MLLPGRSPACLGELSPENRQASAERAAQMLARVASEREAVPRADGPREEGRPERKLRKRSEKPLKCEESPLQETGVHRCWRLPGGPRSGRGVSRPGRPGAP